MKKKRTTVGAVVGEEDQEGRGEPVKKKRTTVGERIAAAHERDIILTLDANAVPYEGTSLKDDDHETLSSKLARRIDSALKRAVREGYDLANDLHDPAFPLDQAEARLVLLKAKYGVNLK